MRLGVAGAAGRMGQSLLACVDAYPAFEITSLLVRQTVRDLPDLPQSVKVTHEAQALFEHADVVIDFTSPEMSLNLLRCAEKAGVPLLVGTTGLGSAFWQMTSDVARRVPLLVASNTSLGVAVLTYLVEKAASILKGYDVTLQETHHRHKKDAPSGTAKSLMEALVRQGVTNADVHSMRAGAVLGEHTLTWTNDLEQITLSHSCLDRRLFARGALDAALWLVQQKPGLYTMRDVLGLCVL